MNSATGTATAAEAASSRPLCLCPQTSIALCRERPARTLAASDLPAARWRICPAPALEVNQQSPDFVPLEKQVPQPHQSPQLKDDSWLRETSHQPGTLQEIGQALERYRQLIIEQRGDEFTFEPLITTLENMHIFIRHIRDGKQFGTDLTPKEDRAMAWLEEKTAILLAQRAPYKRTVQLAMALLTVYEQLTNARILAPLQKQKPLFFRNHWLWEERPLCLDQVIAWSWGGNNRCKIDGWSDDLSHPDCFAVSGISFNSYLHCPALLIYPSFQPLELDDFCGFGHLPLYPVGMTTAYALDADGKMRSPLTFALHDLVHMRSLALIGEPFSLSDPQDGCWLYSPARRLAFRQLLLDACPPTPALSGWRTALTLLLFQLFHELAPRKAVPYLTQGYASFLGCLTLLGRARRELRTGYHPRFRQVTDSQAAMVALWAVRLWQHWYGADYHLTPELLRAHARQFAVVEAPRLQEHLTFIDRHRGTVRQLLAEECEWNRARAWQP